MPGLPKTEAELKALRVQTFNSRQEALAQNDQAKAGELKSLLNDIDDSLDDLAFSDLSQVSIKIAEFRAKLEALTKTATSWPFGRLDAPVDHERPFRGPLQDNDADDTGPNKPAPDPAKLPAAKVPVVNPGWATDYTKLWDSMQILPQWQDDAMAIAKRIVAKQGRYAAAVSGTKVPWWFIGVVHAMECSLRFDQHLHNGDPLSARTVQVPRGRPPVGSPPFTWEVSAKDAVVYEKLDQVTDWSLTSVLFHWHRYNGINNEYKKRRIPTPYLWSGSQHYRKGKYVADHVFDENAVSGQVGAAVLLKALTELGAVTIGKRLSLESNAAAATEHAASLTIETTGTFFKHVAAELDFPGSLKSGSSNPGQKQGVRRVQEWLNLHDCITSIDGGFGESTVEQLKKFQVQNGRQPTGELDEETWALLTAPMRRTLAKIDHGTSSSMEDAVMRVALQHIAEKPIEVGGDNAGPWVRLYMGGKDGTDQLWCAGFVCLLVAQASRDLGIKMPFKRQIGVDSLVADAKAGGRFIKEGDVPSALVRKSKLRPGFLFVVRASASDWVHAGLVTNVRDQTFDTIEGNTSGDGGSNGTMARAGNRSYTSKDFLSLV